MNDIRLVVWNVAWARPDTDRGKTIQQYFAAARPDLLCVTEGFAELLPASGYVIESDPDYGYPPFAGRRKVLLWSRQPWSRVDRVGIEALPQGRFVSGTTNTPLGPVDVYGVCIPWRDAHVRGGRKDRKAWEEHTSYISALNRILSDRKSEAGAIVAGFALPKAMGNPKSDGERREVERSLRTGHFTGGRVMLSPAVLFALSGNTKIANERPLR